MQLAQSFDVEAPLDVVWRALIDVERVAPCLPGAAVTGRNDDGSYAGTFSVKIGPTWQWDNGWLLPEASLGWGFMSWCGYWLTGKGRKPWTFTPEQARFLLWYYAVDSAGDFLYHSAMLQRLKGLPGFGEQKARIFLALLGKQYGVTPTGWRAAAGEFGKAGTHISVADIVDAQSLGKVRSHKKQMKAAAKAAK